LQLRVAGWASPLVPARLPLVVVDLLGETQRVLSSALKGTATVDDGVKLFVAIGGKAEADRRQACVDLAARLPRPRLIRDRAGDDPYLSRFYLLGGPVDPATAFGPSGETLPRAPWTNLPVNLYLHHFHTGDNDAALHSHPWREAAAFVLAGGYHEDRRVGSEVVRSAVLPGAFNVLRATDYHRVTLIEADAWSLFLTGPSVKSWDFWDPTTNQQIPWRQYIEARHNAKTYPAASRSW
jgi:hypothetical protein